MAEYIEREALLKSILELPPKMDEQGYGWLGRRGVWQVVSDFPAADVWPVVTCADCKYNVREVTDLFGNNAIQCITGLTHRRNWFCADGKKGEES